MDLRIESINPLRIEIEILDLVRAFAVLATPALRFGEFLFLEISEFLSYSQGLSGLKTTLGSLIKLVVNSSVVGVPVEPTPKRKLPNSPTFTLRPCARFRFNTILIRSSTALTWAELLHFHLPLPRGKSRTLQDLHRSLAHTVSWVFLSCRYPSSFSRSICTLLP